MIQRLCCGVAIVHLCGPKPTMPAATEEMSNDKPQNEPPKKRHTRTFIGIGFHLTPALHEAMKALAAERDVNLEDVYREATETFLTRRETEVVAYRGAPLTRCATRVSVLMARELSTRMRAAAKSDGQVLVNAFETAVRLYLESYDQYVDCSKR